MARVKKSYPAIDIAKLVMAILVVAIHVRPFTGNVAFFYDDCITRIADPLFFIITAFFMFQKAFQEELSWKCLQQYMLRIGRLYGIWCILYLPVITEHTIAANSGKSVDIIALLILRKLCLEGPYGAMWFMTALLLAIPMTYVLTKLTKPWVCLIISAPFFLYTVLEMEYTGLVSGIVWMDKLYDGINLIFGWLANGLTYGFLFCALGMMVAWNRNRKAGEDKKLMRYLIGLVISLTALFIEVIVIRRYELGVSFGAMLCLIPVSYCLLQVLLRIQMQDRPIYIVMRKLSILIFVIHYGIMELFQWLFRNQAVYMNSTTLQYAVVLVVTIGISLTIVKLSERPHMGWLKILY